MNPISAGVIGTGFIGPVHIEALRRLGNVDVVAVASQSLERAEDLAARYDVPKAYEGWKRLIDDPDVRVIHNCAPNILHFEINRAAILAGKHIVSEKPLTMNSRESWELVRLARNRGVVNAVNFNYRFYPLIQHARGLAAKGDLGKVYLVHGHYLQDWLLRDTDYNWRVDARMGGQSRAMADIGSHWCDLVQFVTGLRITAVLADLLTVHPKRMKPRKITETFGGKGKRASGPFPVRTEDAGILMLRFNNGARGGVTVSQVSAGRKNHEWFEVDGSERSLCWNQEEPNQLWVGHREKANEVLLKDPSLLSPQARRYAHYPGGHPEGYPDGAMNLFMNVYDFIRRGKDPRGGHPDFPTFADGHWEVRIVEAILKSHRKQRWVRLEP